MIALLDANVLLALAWPTHQHHNAAHRWFDKNSRRGWATCAVTQLAFIRLSANPAYAVGAVSPMAAAAFLADTVKHRNHKFWNSLPAVESKIFAAAIGHQQVNDAWLVEMARRHRGVLATFDARLVCHDRGGNFVEIIEI